MASKQTKYTIETLSSTLAKMEGKKVQARIGEVRELLALLSDLVYVTWLTTGDVQGIGEILWKNGERRFMTNQSSMKKKGKENERSKKRSKSSTA